MTGRRPLYPSPAFPPPNIYITHKKTFIIFGSFTNSRPAVSTTTATSPSPPHYTTTTSTPHHMSVRGSSADVICTATQIPRLSIRELFSRRRPDGTPMLLRVPVFQRRYCWGQEQSGSEVCE